LNAASPAPATSSPPSVDETETTLKRLVREKGRLFRAANPRYADIIPTRGLESQGVVVGLIRRFAA